MRDIVALAEQGVLLYDGSKGSLLQGMGLTEGVASESWNTERPDLVREVHRAYRAAGAEVLQTNTFPGNRVTLSRHGMEDQVSRLNREGARLAREVAGDELPVAASVGPTGLLFEPAGDLTFQKAYEIFSEQARALEEGGADSINLETFTDLAEIRAALLAVRESTSLSVLASTTYDAGGRTMSGNSPEAAAVVCQSLGAAMVGANCSTGPEEMVSVIEAMARVAWRPLLAKPNAGLPEVVDGETVYRETPEHFASFAQDFMRAGVRLLGGCCGTTPEIVSVLGEQTKAWREAWSPPDEPQLIASPYSIHDVSRETRVGRVKLEGAALSSAAREGRTQEVVDACAEACSGVDALFLDFGELAVEWDWWAFVSNLSMYARNPIIVRARDPRALEGFLRLYPGRCGVTSDSDPSIMRRYGALIVPDNRIAD